MAEYIKVHSYPDSDPKEDEDYEPVGNPIPPSDVDLDLLRGDRIGDTVYSGKWCIQTVMKMLQSNVVMKSEEAEKSEEGKLDIVDMDEDLQNEVGVLWDMTSNVEVCQYLQSVGAIESIYHIIANSKCPRATEMCVGMLANIVTHEELWQSLHLDNTLFSILIPLFGSTDQPVLLEFSRFFNTALSHPENSHCYSIMCSHRPLVTQEILRILSGSTNCDLLKQITELTHILMYLDPDDSHFNTLFADPDFILAVLEASKEIGYEQESGSQTSVMQIFHFFTTYQAGIDAIETVMEAITEAIIKYLHCLCHSLNLSSHGETIGIIISLLNHIFCRSLVVRIELMSSSKHFQYILKILIAIYRKLGFYDSITCNVNSPQRHHHAHHRHHHTTQNKTCHGHGDNRKKMHVSASSWESNSVEEEESKSTKGEAVMKSWSERAGVGELTPKNSIVTPDPSPKQARKEIELLSWSERRMASPLVNEAGIAQCTDVWKMPQETKLKKKKSKSVINPNLSSDTTESKDGKTDSKSEGKEGDGGGDELSSTTVASVAECKGEESHGARHPSTHSHNSGGFSPSLSDSDVAEENMECEHHEDKTEAGTDKVGQEADKSNCHVQVGDADANHQMDQAVSDKNEPCEKNAIHVSESREQRRAETMKTEEGEDRRNSRSCHTNLDKYHKLLSSVREFLSDFFNNMREGLLTEQGTPVIKDLMSFLNTQCRHSSMKVLVFCLGSSRDMSTPVGRLIHLASCFHSSSLHTLLLDFTRDKD